MNDKNEKPTRKSEKEDASIEDKQSDAENPSVDDESLIEFPCEFPVKVMGAGIPEFHACVNKIAAKHDPDFRSDENKQNNSKTGKYVSLTLNIHAKDKEQLDKLYQELTDHELVLWAL